MHCIIQTLHSKWIIMQSICSPLNNMKMAMLADYKPMRYEGKGFLRNLNIRIHRDITGEMWFGVGVGVKKKQAVSFHGANWTNRVDVDEVAPVHVTIAEVYGPSSLRTINLITRPNPLLLFVKDWVYVSANPLVWFQQ